MLPTLREGDRLLVRYDRRPRPGEVAVVRLPASASGGPDRVVAVKRVGGVDESGWWVLRDNPREGLDSTHVGSIAAGDVLGLVVARLWPRPGRVRPRL